ncbi:MAG: hypothetical protein Q9163_003490 [Psora crenata]
MVEENKWRPPGEEEDEEGDEEVDETAYKHAKDAVLFVIEVSKSMLTTPPPTDSKRAERDSPTSAALKCAYALMQQRIISNPNDMMGVLLYGTEQTKFQDEESERGSLSYPHCYLLIDLDIPAAQDVRALRDLVEDKDESKRLLVPSEERVSMANILFCANQIFTTKAPNFASRRLFIVTDEDNPHPNDKQLRSAAAVRARDLYDLGVIIELFPISRPDHDFDRSRFYDDIIYNNFPTDPEAPAPISGGTAPKSTEDGISLLYSLLSAINSKAVPRRAQFSSMPLEIGPGFRISVKGYILFKRQEPKRSCYVWLEGEKPQIAVGTTMKMAEDTARAVEKVEIKKAYKFGGEQITFTPEEVAALRHFGDPGITIIGFKPAWMLPIWANIKPATFLYPSEEDYVGSTRVFSALQQKLLKDNLIGLTWFVARKNAVPVIAALLPGAERLDENGSQIVPPGMWLAPLPFADDIRQNPETTLIRGPEPLIDRMREVIQQLQLPKARYDPSKYPNPALQWHYRILQAMALEEDLPEKPEDKTIPKYKQIHKRAGPYVIDWGHELQRQYGELGRHNDIAPVSKKRPAPAEGDALPTREKRTKMAGDIDDVQMKKAFEKQTIAKMTVADLKGWLQGKGMPVGGKKDVLVERIEEYFEQQR